MHPRRALPTASPRRCSRLHFDSCHASKLNAREELQGWRLHRGGSAVQRGRPCRRQVPLRSAVRQPVALSIPSAIAQAEGPRCFVVVIGLVLTGRRVNRERPCDVWPNITGTATLYRGDTYPFGEFSVTGAFSKYGNPVGTTYGETDRGTKQSGFKLDASLANEIFGDSQSVQPASIRFLPCIKF